MSVQPEKTWVVKYSWEATTLDYLSPLWYQDETVVYLTQEAAEEAVSAKYAASKGGQPIAYKAEEVKAPRPEAGYSDPFLEAEFAANRQYWADRAAVARAAQEAQAEIFALKGQEVEVVKGRKVPKGTKGVVFWVGESSYGGYRVGFKTESGETHWTAQSNVEIVKEMVSA